MQAALAVARYFWERRSAALRKISAHFYSFFYGPLVSFIASADDLPMAMRRHYRSRFSAYPFATYVTAHFLMALVGFVQSLNEVGSFG
jgi:hypothetical protein